MKTIVIPFEIFKILIELAGHLTHSEVSKLIGKDSSDKLSDWYFNNRSRIK